MPASKAEQVLNALTALLQTVSDASVERNSALPEKIPDGGLIILRDGEPGEPERALGGLGLATRPPLSGFFMKLCRSHTRRPLISWIELGISRDLALRFERTNSIISIPCEPAG